MLTAQRNGCFSYHSLPYHSVSGIALGPEISVTSKGDKALHKTSEPCSVGGQKRCPMKTFILLQFMALTLSRMQD